MSSSLRIHFIGDVFCDIIAESVKNLPKWGEDVLSPIKIFAGGSCLNTIVHAKTFASFINKNEMIMKIYSSIGDDSQGEIIIKKLMNEGIQDISNIKRFSNETTGSCIVISGEKDRCFITDRGCIKTLSLNYFDKDQLSSCDLVHIGGFYNCNSLYDEIPLYYNELRIKGITTSLNPQFDASLQWNHIEAICPFLNFLICNEIEATSISKQNDYDSAANLIIGWGCENVVITLGKNGAICYSKDFTSDNIVKHISLGYVVDNIIDTTGAGDAFAGAFLVSWLNYKNIPIALQHGCLCGSAAITQIGGSTSSFASLSEISVKAQQS